MNQRKLSCFPAFLLSCFPAFLLSCLFIGCWDATSAGKVNYGAEVKGKVVIGHSRVVPTSVKDMVNNRSAVLSNLRAAEGETTDDVQKLVSYVYDEVMKDIPEEDKEEFIEEGSIDIPIESGLALSEEDQKMVYRGADGKDYIGDPIFEMYQLNCKLKDLIEVSFTSREIAKDDIAEFITTEMLAMFPDTIALNKAVESIIVASGYNKIEDLAKKFSCTIDTDKYYLITNRITELNSGDIEQKYADGRTAVSKRSGSPEWLVPANIPDAAVFVMQSDGYIGWLIRWGISPHTFSHAGLFSKAAFDNKSKLYPNVAPLDIKCIQSATGDEGTTLQSVGHFGEAKKFAAVIPKHYNSVSADKACMDVESIFKCETHGVAYDIPWWEIFCNSLWGSDTSHNKKSNRAYCSKLPYTGWRLNGVNVDADNDSGNLIHPQELNDSQYDRYLLSPIQVTVYWVSCSLKGCKKKSKTITIGWNIWKTYENTTVQIYRKG